MNNPFKKINKLNISKTDSYLKRNGMVDTVYKISEKLSRDKEEAFYNEEFGMLKVKEPELSEQREATFTHNYTISIVVPAYETEPEFLIDLLESVVAQSYPGWELIVADASKTGIVRQCLEQYAQGLDRETACKIIYLPLVENAGIAGNTNAGLSIAQGEYIGFLDHDDVLEPDALYEVMKVLEDNLFMENKKYSNKAKVIYTDEDKLNSKTMEYYCPHYKPDFNIDLLRSNNYICHFLVVRTELAKLIGGFRPEYDGAQDYDFILRMVEKIPVSAIFHIDKVLYHWRSHEKSTSENPMSKTYAYEAGKRAVTDHLKRKCISATVSDTKYLGFYRVKYNLEAATVRHYSREAWNNITEEEFKQIDEDFVMILASDLEPITGDYIDELVGVLTRYDVGCVGGKIYDKNFRVESAGFTKNEEGKYVPNYSGLNGHYSGYMHRASLMQKVDGVSLDCMMIRKSAIEFNDGKPNLTERYITVYDPYAEFRRI